MKQSVHGLIISIHVKEQGLVLALCAAAGKNEGAIIRTRTVSLEKSFAALHPSECAVLGKKIRRSGFVDRPVKRIMVTLSNCFVYEEIISFPGPAADLSPREFFSRVSFSINKTAEHGGDPAAYLYTRSRTSGKTYLAVLHTAVKRNILSFIRALHTPWRWFPPGKNKLCIENETMTIMRMIADAAADNGQIFLNMNRNTVQVTVVHNNAILVDQKIRVNKTQDENEKIEFILTQLVIVLAFLKNDPVFSRITTIVLVYNGCRYTGLYDRLTEKLGSVWDISVYTPSGVFMTAETGTELPACDLYLTAAGGRPQPVRTAPGAQFYAGKKIRRVHYRKKCIAAALAVLLAGQLVWYGSFRLLNAFALRNRLAAANAKLADDLARQDTEKVWQGITDWNRVNILETSADPSRFTLARGYTAACAPGPLLAAIIAALPERTTMTGFHFSNGYLNAAGAENKGIFCTISGVTPHPYRFLHNLQQIDALLHIEFESALQQAETPGYKKYALRAEVRLQTAE